MARPTVAEASELELMESMAMMMAAIRLATEVLAVRTQQICAETRGDQRLAALASPVAEELELLEVAADGVQEILREWLEVRQHERSVRNANRN